jgi:hypothetical protein
VQGALVLLSPPAEEADALRPAPRRGGQGRESGAARVQLRLAAGWRERHPRAMHLLGEEAQVWQKHGLLRLSLSSD